MRLKPPPSLPPLRWTPLLRRLPVLSIRQPYAWLVVNGIKTLENRSWRTHYRGPVLIHASASLANLTVTECEKYGARGGVLMPENYAVGGVIGYVEIVDCVRHHPSIWKHRGTWGWILAHARPLKFRPCKGAVSFFYPRWQSVGRNRKSRRIGIRPGVASPRSERNDSRQ